MIAFICVVRTVFPKSKWAYYVDVAKGLDVNKPRNLAKSA